MRALFSKSCVELSLAALVLILLSSFPASAVMAHSQRTFTYIINPVHTDLYFTTSEGGSALDSGAEIEITGTSSSTIQYYLHFSSNEMGTHSVTVTVTPLVQTVSGTEVAIPHTDSLSERLPSSMRVEQNQSSYLYSYYDEGDILIRYPSEGNENRNLVGGGYTTNIYIHLVCGQ